MVSKIRINTNRLKTDAERMNGYIKQIKKEIEDMKRSVSELDAMWDGTSSEAFKKAFLDDMNAMANVIKNLESIHAYETNAKTEYENCEKNVSALISEIKI